MRISDWSSDVCSSDLRGADKSELHDLMRQADYVSINCPRNKETLNLIDERCYGLMKPTAFFITTARGGIHTEAALAEALAEKRIAGAGLDVWDVEPPKPDDPLLRSEVGRAAGRERGGRD